MTQLDGVRRAQEARSVGARERSVSPSVSVVIPCYGQAHFLDAAIDSVHRQSVEAHEIVVVDDGSPDDVRAVVERYPAIRYLRQANQGLAAARNAGLAECSGDFVIFLDADDLLLPHALEVGATTLTRVPEAALAWGFNRPIDAEGRALGEISNPWARESARYEDLLRNNVVGPPVGVIFRRSTLELSGGFCSDPVAAEDYELYLRLAHRHSIVCHGQLIAEYRYHDANMSSDLDVMLKGVLHVLESQRPRVAGDPELRRALRRGVRDAWRRYDGRRRQRALRKALADGRWAHAGREVFGLLTHYPSLVARALGRKVRRRG